MIDYSELSVKNICNAYTSYIVACYKYNELEKFIDFSQITSCLDFGAGTLGESAYISDSGLVNTVYYYDLNLTKISNFKNIFKRKNLKIYNLKSKLKFDLIILSNVIQYLNKDQISHILDYLLNKNGIILLTIPKKTFLDFILKRSKNQSFNYKSNFLFIKKRLKLQKKINTKTYLFSFTNFNLLSLYKRFLLSLLFLTNDTSYIIFKNK